MSEPEFYASATLGFRRWRFSPRDSPLALYGLVEHGFRRPLRYRWDLDVPNHAECMRLKLRPGSFGDHGGVPSAGCSCGFYAHGRRDARNSETTVHVVGGVVAGWGDLELHGRGFRCGVAKVLALFAPDPGRRYADYGGADGERWAALREMCADHAIPLLEHDTLREDDEARHYAHERDLALLEEQLRPRGASSADVGAA